MTMTDPKNTPRFEEILSRMAEQETSRFLRHKALLRASMMEVFTDTLPARDWNSNDDRMLDIMVHWRLGLSVRAGEMERIHSAETAAAIASAPTVTRGVDVQADGMHVEGSGEDTGA